MIIKIEIIISYTFGLTNLLCDHVIVEVCEVALSDYIETDTLPHISSQTLAIFLSSLVSSSDPLKSMLAKIDHFGRLLKWSVELSRFDISYSLQTTIKEQALANFFVDFYDSQDVRLA